MALSSLTHIQASSGEWVVLVSGRGGHVQIRRYVLERLRCSTPFHLCIESLPPSLWVPSPLYALRSFCCSWSLVVFVVPVSLLPPPLSPFTRTTVLVPIPSRPTGEYFVVVPLALSPLVPPGLGPVDLLTAVRAPFHVHPPHSYAMLVVHSHLALNWHIALIMRSVDEPAPRARPTGPRLPCLLTTGLMVSM